MYGLEISNSGVFLLPYTNHYYNNVDTRRLETVLECDVPDLISNVRGNKEPRYAVRLIVSDSNNPVGLGFRLRSPGPFSFQSCHKIRIKMWKKEKLSLNRF